jgi:hypothetical protein
MKAQKGTNFIYKELILKTALKRQSTVAPVFYTWPMRLQHIMTNIQWCKALENIKSYYVSPCAKWCTHQIFLGTIWTTAKAAQASNGTMSEECPNCSCPNVDTLHMFIYCVLAKRIWRRIGKIIKMTEGKQGILQLTPQRILFHKQTKNYQETALIIAGKYAIALLTRTIFNKPKNPSH